MWPTLFNSHSRSSSTTHAWIATTETSYFFLSLLVSVRVQVPAFSWSLLVALFDYKYCFLYIVWMLRLLWNMEKGYLPQKCRWAVKLNTIHFVMKLVQMRSENQTCRWRLKLRCAIFNWLCNLCRWGVKVRRADEGWNSDVQYSIGYVTCADEGWKSVQYSLLCKLCRWGIFIQYSHIVHMREWNIIGASLPH